MIFSVDQFKGNIRSLSLCFCFSLNLLARYEVNKVLEHASKYRSGTRTARSVGFIDRKNVTQSSLLGANNWIRVAFPSFLRLISNLYSLAKEEVPLWTSRAWSHSLENYFLAFKAYINTNSIIIPFHCVTLIDLKILYCFKYDKWLSLFHIRSTNFEMISTKYS